MSIDDIIEEKEAKISKLEVKIARLQRLNREQGERLLRMSFEIEDLHRINDAEPLFPRKRADKNGPGYVYLLKTQMGLWKIGRTVAPKGRLASFQVNLPFTVEYEHLIEVKNMDMAENILHKRYRQYRKGRTEFFDLPDACVEEIKAIESM